MEPSSRKIEKTVSGILPQIKEIRHHLHRHPELSLKEFNTADYVRHRLTSLEMEIFPPFLETDVVALLSGKTPGRNITLRADMDALPIQEKNDLPYRSVRDKVMHACGHDGHTAMLLGAAMVLEKLKEDFAGSVRFIFQPGEEIVAAGKELVAQGVLNDPRPHAVVAPHAWAEAPLGAVCSRPGPLMAAADFFKLVVQGKGGHGSTPEKTIDPILTTGKILNTLYQLPSRKFSALDPVVMSICRVQAGANANVIPDEALLEGSIRYLSKSAGEKMPALFESTVKNECDHAGAAYDLAYVRTYAPTINDARIVDMGKHVVEKHLGGAFWMDIPEPVMGSEDFSYYLDKAPGAMFFLGMGENSPSLHTATFDFNDDALKNGVLFLVLSTLELLEQHP